MSISKPISPAQLRANVTKKNKYLRYPTAKLQQKLAAKTVLLAALLMKVEDLKASIELLNNRLTQTNGPASGGEHEV
jgi:hypothetical protein